MLTDDPPDVNALAKADTQPRTFLFVPYELAVGFVIGCAALDVQFHSWKLGFIVVPFWAAAALLCKRDLNGVRVFLVRIRLALTLMDAHRWGGPSASPWPLGDRRDRNG